MPPPFSSLDVTQVKGRKLRWRLNPKGLAKEVLPTQPILPPSHLDPWWTVSVVNLTEAEFRELNELEVATLKTASLPRGDASHLNGTSGAGTHRPKPTLAAFGRHAILFLILI